MARFLALVACCAVVVQGGYFPAFYLWAGAALAVGIAVSPRKIRCPKGLLPLVLLSGWYLLASAVNGPSAEGLAQAALPMVCLLFALLTLSLDEKERRTMLVWIARFGGVAAIAAILAFFGVLPVAGAVTAHRLQFTFQYVNAAGIWFAAVLLLRGELKDKWVNYLCPFVAVALLLTRSIGAIGAYLVLQIAALLGQYGKKSWKAWAAAGGAALLGGIAILTRIPQGLGTFQERLVQSGDGLRGMLAAPVFGFGPGSWGDVKPLFESYDYSAQVVHNSYVQAGVSAGFPALLFLLAAVVLALRLMKGRSPALKAAALLIPLHAVMDFTLCFFAVDALLMGILALPAKPEGRALPRWGQRIFGGAALVFCVIAAVLRLN